MEKYLDVKQPTPCLKCKEGNLHLELRGPTGYELECDKCHHSFPVKIGAKK